MVTYYDIGVNLFCKQFRDPEQILQNAADAGVSCILTGTDMKENQRIDRFLRTHDAYGTCGIHPHNADRAKDADFEQMEKMLLHNPKLVAVGECGLDFDRMFSTKENQIACLETHIALAEKLGKPLFLHERSASEDFIQCFRKHADICQKSVVHCFTGDRKRLEQYLEMGFSIGITGWICDDRRAEELRDAVQILPLDRLLIETDAPYLTPRNVPNLARTNVPENVRYVAKTLAQYRNVSEEEIISHAKENTERLFALHD